MATRMVYWMLAASLALGAAACAPGQKANTSGNALSAAGATGQALGGMGRAASGGVTAGPASRADTWRGAVRQNIELDPTTHTVRIHVTTVPHNAGIPSTVSGMTPTNRPGTARGTFRGEYPAAIRGVLQHPGRGTPGLAGATSGNAVGMRQGAFPFHTLAGASGPAIVTVPVGWTVSVTTSVYAGAPAQRFTFVPFRGGGGVPTGTPATPGTIGRGTSSLMFRATTVGRYALVGNGNWLVDTIVVTRGLRAPTISMV